MSESVANLCFLYKKGDITVPYRIVKIFNYKSFSQTATVFHIIVSFQILDKIVGFFSTLTHSPYALWKKKNKKKKEDFSTFLFLF